MNPDPTKLPDDAVLNIRSFMNKEDSPYNKCDILTVLLCGGGADACRPIKRFFPKGSPVYHYDVNGYLNMISGHGFPDESVVLMNKSVSKVTAKDLSWFGLTSNAIGKNIMEVRLY